MPSKRSNGQTPGDSNVQTAEPFRGFPRNRYTQVPDLVFDELMAQLSNDELRVLLHVIRFTEGFKRDTDNISLGQFVNGTASTTSDWRNLGTGLSRASVARGIRGLVKRGILITHHNRDPRHGNQATTYAIRFEDTLLVSPAHHPRLTGALPWSTGETSLVHRRDLQETPLETDGRECQRQIDERQREPAPVDILWEKAKVELALQMSKANYETWFRDTRLVALDGQRVTIAAPNHFTMEWLETRCVPLIRKTLVGILRHPVECTFVVQRSVNGEH